MITLNTVKWLAAASCAIVLAAFASFAHAGPFAYVPGGNASGASLAVIDTATATVTTTINLGANLAPPYSVLINPAGTRVYVQAASGGAAAIDATTNTVISHLDISNAVLNPAGDKIYSTASNGQPQVVVTDSSTGAVLATIPVGDYPGALTFNQTGTRAYVVSENPGALGERPTLSMIDTGTYSVIATTNVVQSTGYSSYPGTTTGAAFPFSISVNPAGTRVYVLDTEPGADSHASFVSVYRADSTTLTLDLAAGTPVGANAPLQPRPSGAVPLMMLNASGSLLVVADAASQSLTVINTADNTVMGSAILYGDISGLTLGPTSPNNNLGTTAYVTTNVYPPGFPPAGELWLIDLNGGQIYERSQVGIRAGPMSPEFTPAGTRLYIVNSLDNSVLVVRPDGGVLSTIPLGSGPSVVRGSFIGPAGNDSQYALTVTINGGGSVAANPVNLACAQSPPTCSATFPALTDVSVASLPSAGWTFIGWSGACNGIYSCSLTMNQPQTLTANFVPTCATAAGQSGWWWNPAEGGRGYFIDNQISSIYFSALEYDVTGRSTWYVASGAPNGSTCSYNGVLQTYSGGQTLTGAYRPPASSSNVGSFAVTFTDATHATVSLPGETLALERYVYAKGGSAGTASPVDPRTGIYWNPAEGGRGFGIEVQNGIVYMVGYMYDGSGLPIWYVSSPNQQSHLSENFVPRERCCTGFGPPPPPPLPYIGQWVTYANGQTLGGPYRTPTVVNPNAGSMTLQFFSTFGAGGTLTLPDGRQIPVTRYAQ